ncbi:MAG: acetoacetate decarboxylase family protein [Proteobacteria bacterium]|nr:acetoacetate decarboxylase family protein [Pseudomonadota bacterium]
MYKTKTFLVISIFLLLVISLSSGCGLDKEAEGNALDHISDDTRLLPSPWTLHGDGYIIITRSSDSVNLEDADIPANLVDSYENPFNVMMMVDYKDSPAGPYRELLYIPGTFLFQDGERHASITKIFVDSRDSLVNGRLNWGIPKEMADFEISKNGRTESFTISSQGKTFANFSMTTLFGPKIPIGTKLVPEGFRTLGQVLDGTTFIYALAGRGFKQLALFQPEEFDSTVFPDMTARSVIAAVKISDFELVFPVAEQLAGE